MAKDFDTSMIAEAKLKVQNTVLRDEIAKLAPYSSELISQNSLLRIQNEELRQKLIKQDDMLVREQAQF